jgi:hypothetical protein
MSLVERIGRSRSWWVETPEELAKRALGVWVETGRHLTLTTRALLAFRITVGDLVRGVSIENRNLMAMMEIERVLVTAIDALDTTVAAALGFERTSEDVLAPGEDDNGITPARWPGRMR